MDILNQDLLSAEIVSCDLEYMDGGTHLIPRDAYDLFVYYCDSTKDTAWGIKEPVSEEFIYRRPYLCDPEERAVYHYPQDALTITAPRRGRFSYSCLSCADLCQKYANNYVH